jgi:transcription elongation factor Elf1
MICSSRLTELVECPGCGEPQVGAEVVIDDDAEYWVCGACGECVPCD